MGLLVLWSRDAVLRAIENLTPGLALPVALLILVIAILAAHGLAGCVSKVVEIACARSPSIVRFASSSGEVKLRRLERL